MVLGDIYQIKFVSRHTLGQNAIGVRHYVVNAVATPAPSLTEIANRIIDVVGPELKSAMSSAWTFQGAKIRLFKPGPGVFLPTTHGAGPGSLVGESLPPQVAGVISLRSTVARARCRGRFYVPCPTETDSGSGSPLALLLTEYDQLGAALIASITVPATGGGSATLAPVLMSVQKDKPDATFQIDQFVTRRKFGTQRRRSAINKPDVDEFG